MCRDCWQMLAVRRSRVQRLSLAAVEIVLPLDGLPVLALLSARARLRDI